MPYSPIEVLWVIGFAVSTVLGIVIISYRRYKEYSLKKQAERVHSDKEFVRRQMEIEKWKRKVFRP
jgi:ribosomal protein L31E